MEVKSKYIAKELESIGKIVKKNKKRVKTVKAGKEFSQYINSTN